MQVAWNCCGHNYIDSFQCLVFPSRDRSWKAFENEEFMVITFSGEEDWRAFFHQLGFVLGGFESARFMNEACVIPVLLFGSENWAPV